MHTEKLLLLLNLYNSTNQHLSNFLYLIGIVHAMQSPTRASLAGKWLLIDVLPRLKADMVRHLPRLKLMRVDNTSSVDLAD